MEPGRGIAGNTIQPRYDDIQPRYDDGNTHSTLSNQVDINQLLQIPPATCNVNAPPVVASQAEATPSAASTKSPSSGGLPYGSNGANGHDIGILPNPQGNGVQSVSPEPVLSTPDFPTEASGWSIINESPASGPGYSIHDYMVQADVDWRNLNPSPLSNPPIQNMVHQDGYDPNRIPASVFSSNPATPMDWSNASNESLFSIHMGNSFSGYPGMFKSGEFPTIEQLNKPQNPFENFEAKANEGSNLSPGLRTLPETPVEHKTQQSANIKDDIITHEGLSKISTTTTEESKENHGNKAFHESNLTAASLSAHQGGFPPFETTNSIPNRLSDESAKSSSSINRLSNESVRSCGSFAFPVLVSDLGKSCSFRSRSDKKEEQQIKQQQHQHHQQQQHQQQQSEPPETSTTSAAVRNRGCFSWFPGWHRCW